MVEGLTKEQLREQLKQNERWQWQLKIYRGTYENFYGYFFKNDYKESKSIFHKELNNILFDAEKKKISRVAVAAPRGHGKSQHLKMWMARQMVFKNFDCVTYVSETFEKAIDHADTIKRAFEVNKRIKGIWGEQVSEQWSRGDFTTSDGVTVQCLGAGQSPRGLGKGSKRPKLIVLDDVESEENISTKEQRNKLKNWFWSALMPSGDADCIIIIIGTIIHEDSLLNNLLQMPGWSTKKFSAINSENKPLWPEKYSLKKLMQIKNELFAAGKSDSWFSEYINEPINDENREFKREWFEKFSYFEKELPIPLNVFLVTDLALSKQTHSDYSAILAIGVDINNVRWVLEARRGKWSPTELIDNLLDMNFKWKPLRIAMQKDLIYSSIYPFLQKKMMETGTYLPLQEITLQGRTKKEERIRGMIPWIQTGKFKIKREMTDYIEEFLSFPKGRHDDMIDATADINAIAYAPKQQDEKTEQDIIDQILRRHQEKALVFDEHLGVLDDGQARETRDSFAILEI